MEECTIEWYEINSSFFRNNQTENFEIDKKLPQYGDWSNSIYFFLKKENLDLYKDTDHPYPMEFQNLKKLPYIKCTYKCFAGEGDYDKEMPTIIQEIEELTGQNKPSAMPFMKWLGNIGYAFQCYNISDIWEIAIPFPLLLRSDSWKIINL